MVAIVNTSDIKQLTGKHQLFASINDVYGSPPNWSRPQGFISLSKIILEQQVSQASANAHFLKLSNYIKEFSPAEILKLTDDEMRTCQVSRQKAKYLRELSSAILDEKISLEKLSELTPSEVKKRLKGLKGIGDWTADIYMMFCMQAKDMFPVGDVAVIKTVKELCDVRTQEEILSLSENWKPLRSLSSYFLWHYYLQKRGANTK